MINLLKAGFNQRTDFCILKRLKWQNQLFREKHSNLGFCRKSSTTLQKREKQSILLVNQLFFILQNVTALFVNSIF